MLVLGDGEEVDDSCEGLGVAGVSCNGGGGGGELSSGGGAPLTARLRLVSSSTAISSSSLTATGSGGLLCTIEEPWTKVSVLFEVVVDS